LLFSVRVWRAEERKREIKSASCARRARLARLENFQDCEDCVCLALLTGRTQLGLALGGAFLLPILAVSASLWPLRMQPIEFLSTRLCCPFLLLRLFLSKGTPLLVLLAHTSGQTSATQSDRQLIVLPSRRNKTKQNKRIANNKNALDKLIGSLAKMGKPTQKIGSKQTEQKPHQTANNSANHHHQRPTVISEQNGHDNAPQTSPNGRQFAAAASATATGAPPTLPSHKSPNQAAELQPQTVSGGQPLSSGVGVSSMVDTALNERQQTGATSAGSQTSGDRPRDSLASFTSANNQQQQQSSSASVINQARLPAGSFCAAQLSVRNLFWNSTRVGQLARQNCPDGSIGRVSWLCDGELGRFVPIQSPDFSQCRSIWLARLVQQLEQFLESAPSFVPNASRVASNEQLRLHNERALKSLLNELMLMTSTKQLFAEDLRRLEVMLGQMLSHMRSLAVLLSPNTAPNTNDHSLGQQNNDQSWPQTNSFQSGSDSLGPLYEEFVLRLAAILSNLFDWTQRSAWLELGDEQAARLLEARLLGHLRDAGQLWANSIEWNKSGATSGGTRAIRQPNVAAQVTVIQQLLEEAAQRGDFGAQSELLVFPLDQESGQSAGQSAGSRDERTQGRQFRLGSLLSFGGESSGELAENEQQQQQAKYLDSSSELKLGTNLLRELSALGECLWLNFGSISFCGQSAATYNLGRPERKSFLLPTQFRASPEIVCQRANRQLFSSSSPMLTTGSNANSHQFGKLSGVAKLLMFDIKKLDLSSLAAAQAERQQQQKVSTANLVQNDLAQLGATTAQFWPPQQQRQLDLVSLQANQQMQHQTRLFGKYTHSLSLFLFPFHFRMSLLQSLSIIFHSSFFSNSACGASQLAAIFSLVSDVHLQLATCDC